MFAHMEIWYITSTILITEILTSVSKNCLKNTAMG